MSDELQPQDPVASTAPQLTLSDLTLALQTIQVTAQRGAIRADEMAVVGGLHDRLAAFLQAQGVGATPPADTADQPQGE